MKDENLFKAKYYGNYRGIVIQNNDPDRRGRVKVFIPQFATQLVKKLGLKQDVDYEVRFVGTSEILSFKSLEYAKAVNRWVEQAAPIFGSGTAGTYNASTKQFTVSDSPVNLNRFNTIPKLKEGKIQVESTEFDGVLPALNNGAQGDVGATGDAGVPTEEETIGINLQLTSDGAGIKPGASRETEGNAYAGEFKSNSIANSRDYLNQSYAPSVHTNSCKGMMSIPNVGAMVWLFFEGGDPSYPVYFGYAYDSSDWHGMYGVTPNSAGVDYPKSGENAETDTFIKSEKHAINTKAGTLEFIGTDNFEKIKLSHSSGSFYEVNNQVTAEVANRNKSLIVQENYHETVKGEKNTFTTKNSDENVLGDKYIKVGDLNAKNAFVAWKNIDAVAANVRSKFDVKRNTSSTDAIIKGEMPESNPVGSFASNPSKYTIDQINSELQSISNTGSIVLTDAAISAVNQVAPNAPQVVLESVKVGESEPADSLSTQDGEWEQDSTKAQLPEIEREVAKNLIEFEKNMGEGGSEIKHIVKDRIERVGIVNNDRVNVRVDPIGRSSVQSINIDPNGAYTKCAPHPHVEAVGNDTRFPCGSDTLSVGNKWNVIVGAGGISITTPGTCRIGSNLTTITGNYELNLISQGNINIQGGGKVSLGSPTDTGSITSLEHPVQVTVNSGLGVKTNAIIGGSAYVDGELFVNHITAPVEIQETESAQVYGELVPGLIIGYVTTDTGTYPVISVATPQTVKTYTHSHAFKNIPLNLMSGNKTMRNVAAVLNEGKRVPANAPAHAKKEIIT